MNRDNDKGKVLLQKTLILAGINLVLILFLIARLYYLQIIQGEKYKVLSDENRISTRILIPPRGIVYDRNGEILATNEQNFQALIIAEQVQDIQRTLERFKKIIPLDEAEEERIMKDIRRNRKFVPVRLKDNLTWEEVSSVLLNAPYLNGIVIDQGLNRFYPEGEYTAQFLGYVGSVSDKDEKDDPLLFVPGFKIGKAGLEKTFETQLRGQGGNLKSEVNAYGRVMKEIERNKGTPGENLKLTIDMRLQKIAQEAFGDHSGAGVVLDVHSGEILAFVSVPSFDPNLFTTGISHKDWNALLNNERHPLTNKAIMGQYSPGSTFKVVVALAALESGLIDERTRFNCTGAMPLGDHIFHCWRHQGHGPQTLVEALKNSCDIYFYEVALRIGIDRIADMARRLGMGAPTGISLENEQSGLIPDKAWKRAKFGTGWQQGESVIAGIGQGYVLVTPLQLATMLSRIVNGGYAVSPTFTPQDLKTKGKIKKLHLDRRHIELVKQGMFEVVNGDGGTAGRARFDLNGAKMGGKTGTTQVRRISLQERQNGIIKDENLPWNLRNHALFIGYAPHDNPKYAVAVVVEHGSSGSGVAAPIASKILREAIRLDIR